MGVPEDADAAISALTSRLHGPFDGLVHPVILVVRGEDLVSRSGRLKEYETADEIEEASLFEDLADKRFDFDWHLGAVFTLPVAKAFEVCRE